MHRSSESVAAIAAALAKAQTELSNPEKAMVGTVYHVRSESPQSFRYASLSSGLDIIRKTLGGQQIAIAQTTDIDRANGMVNLTTLLLHTSGEWISSDWPVCQLSETSAPRRMGARSRPELGAGRASPLSPLGSSLMTSGASRSSSPAIPTMVNSA